MALKKLTLTIEEELIEKARGYSADHNTSISRLVTQFLARLPTDEKRYSPTVERLIGLLPPNVRVAEYHEHLDEKYGG
ncbi:MAG: DUF6364 family protein [Gemmatimonadaceae bacterium]